MGEVVRCKFGGDGDWVDCFGAGEVEGALDAGVEDYAVEGWVCFRYADSCQLNCIKGAWRRSRPTCRL